MKDRTGRKALHSERGVGITKGNRTAYQTRMMVILLARNVNGSCFLFKNWQDPLLVLSDNVRIRFLNAGNRMNVGHDHVR